MRVENLKFLRGAEYGRVMDAVNQRTQLVGQNRLELLLFRLDGPQLYGINVFQGPRGAAMPQAELIPKSTPWYAVWRAFAARPCRFSTWRWPPVREP